VQQLVILLHALFVVRCAVHFANTLYLWDLGVLGCDTVVLGEWCPVFGWTLVPSSSRVRWFKNSSFLLDCFYLGGKGTTALQTIRNHLLSDTPAHPRRPESLVTPL